MQDILEELWCLYIEDNDPKLGDDEKLIMEKLENAEKVLHKELNEKQVQLLEEFTDHWGELCSVYRKESFIKGIRFATKYLLEATE